jgi:hypothetical protein
LYCWWQEEVGVRVAVGIVLSLVFAPAASASQAAFDADFTGETMRVELYQVGHATEERVSVRRIYRDGPWSGPRAALVDPFGYGRYAVTLLDPASGKPIYSRGFDTMFGEYRTTAPALQAQLRVFERSVRVPWPRRPVVLQIGRRDAKNVLQAIFTSTIDPADYHLIKETPKGGDWVYEAVKNGAPEHKVDLLFVAEGYTAEDREKFKADVDRVTGWLFSYEPYKRLRGDFNVSGVMRPSPERAMDEPRQGVFRKTVLNASFNAFDTDRYMLVEDNHAIREIAAQVPHDTIVILVNSPRYGGGGIYEDYCVTTVDHERSKAVFIHEFGHSFAGLADEYYASDVAYNDFYPKGVEPLEPNITALLDPADLKWKHLATPGVAVPTPYGKAEREALQAERRRARQARDQAVNAAKAKGAPQAELDAIVARQAEADRGFATRLAALDARFQSVADVVGAFEGAGYASEGLYRPSWHCLMISSPRDEFCLVCRDAIERMVRYYAPSPGR